MASRHAQEFMDALHGVESKGELDRMASMFSDEAELRSPTADRAHRGREGAKAFWDAYQRSFEEIHSDFWSVTEAKDTVMMEWTSRGHLADGSPIEYHGVTVMEHEDGRIRRFWTYFDPSKLTERVHTRGE